MISSRLNGKHVSERYTPEAEQLMHKILIKGIPLCKVNIDKTKSKTIVTFEK